MESNEFEYLYGRILALQVFFALLIQHRGQEHADPGERAMDALKSLAKKLPKELNPLAAQRRTGMREGLNSLFLASEAASKQQQDLVDYISDLLND